MKKKFFNINVEKLLQHIQKCQYAFLALSFSILLLASASPAKPPALEELDKLENLLEKIGDRWIDKYYKDLKPDIKEMTGQIEIIPADKTKMKIDSPNGVLVDSTIANNLVNDLSGSATSFMYRDAMAILSDNRKRGIPPLWNSTATLLKIGNKDDIGNRKASVKNLSLEDIGNLWKKYSEQRKLTYVNKVMSLYIADEDPSLATSLEINRIPIQVRKQEISPAMMTTFSQVKRIGKLWNANSDWVLKENGNIVTRKRVDNTLIYALPEDGNQTLKNAVFFVVGFSSQNADLFEPLRKVSQELGIEVKSRFEETFPELSKQNNGKKEEPLSKLRSDLVLETKDPGREINAEVLGIKIAGLNVWWLLPLSLLLVQAYFYLHLSRLNQEISSYKKMVDTYPLGMIYPGTFSKALGVIFLVIGPGIMILWALINLTVILGGFSFTELIIGLILILVVVFSFCIHFVIKEIRVKVEVLDRKNTSA